MTISALGCWPSEEDLVRTRIPGIRKELINEVFTPVAKESGYRPMENNILTHKMYLVYPQTYGVLFSAHKFRDLNLLRNPQKHDYENEISLSFSLGIHRYVLGSIDLVVDANIARAEGGFIYPAYKSGEHSIYSLEFRPRNLSEEIGFAKKWFSELDSVEFAKK